MLVDIVLRKLDKSWGYLTALKQSRSEILMIFQNLLVDILDLELKEIIPGVSFNITIYLNQTISLR